mgnify:CR=1 FL=1
MKFRKDILFFLVFFLIFYLEPTYILGIKFAVLWKFFLFLYIIIKYKNNFKPKDKISKYGYLYTFKNLFNLSSIRYPIQNVYHTIVIFNFPFLYNWLRNNFAEKKLLQLIKKLSIFVIVSSVPFHMHIIEPLGTGMTISTFRRYAGGIDAGFVGIFQNAHAAAIITSFAVINLIFFYKIEKKNIYMLISSLGVINIYLTFVRTGYVMLVVGLLFFIYIGTNYIQKIKAFVLVIVAIFTFIYFANTDLLINRLFNISKYNPSSQTINYDPEAISSGRTLFWAINIAEWWNADYAVKVLGLGEEVARENMERTIGLRIFSHNGFVDSFIENGIIGLLLFLGMFFYILKLVIKNKSSTYFSLVSTSALMFFFMNIFQGGFYFLMDLLLALNFALVNITKIRPHKM